MIFTTTVHEGWIRDEHSINNLNELVFFVSFCGSAGKYEDPRPMDAIHGYICWLLGGGPEDVDYPKIINSFFTHIFWKWG